jgi:hypothetical protein
MPLQLSLNMAPFNNIFSISGVVSACSYTTAIARHPNINEKYLPPIVHEHPRPFREVMPLQLSLNMAPFNNIFSISGVVSACSYTTAIARYPKINVFAGNLMLKNERITDISGGN